MEQSYEMQSGVLAAMFGTILIIALVVWLISVISYWKIFTKAGKPGWASLIPIYNTIVIIEIVKKPVWWFFLLLIPIVNIVYAIWIINLLSKSFGKSEGFTVGLILLPVVFLPILAFDKSIQYIYNNTNEVDHIGQDS
ncbi:DUF5684 domain-containing protein [Flavobacterium alkalisoli]|uniref:DUF5684 domain-containing protein n=1 Tax=Flavobacterium alkalisoli TaxID=2602769 RepID=UPI003A924545